MGALGREVWQQGKNGFEGWTSGPGLNWSGIAGSLFNVGFDALSPVLGGPRFGPERDGRRAFNFSLGGLINSAYNPSSGWAIPGSGKSPTVGAFEYAYSAVANGAANMGYNWIRDQLERPSAPPKVTGPRVVIAGDGSRDWGVQTTIIDDSSPDWMQSWGDEAMSEINKDYRLCVHAVRSWWERYKAWEIERHRYYRLVLG